MMLLHLTHQILLSMSPSQRKKETKGKNATDNCHSTDFLSVVLF